MKTACWLCPLVILTLVGCSDDGNGPRPDMKTDGLVVTDGGVDAVPDATPDGPMTDGPVTDGPTTDGPTTDGPTTDGPTTDGPTTDGPVPSYKITYSVNAAASQYTLNEVMADGTGQQVVPGVSADFSLNSLYIAGVHGPVDVDRTGAVRINGATADWVLLPGALGILVYWTDATTGGFAIVRPDGTVDLPDHGAGTGYADTIAISPDGKLAAAVKEGNKIMLLRLDGTTWSNNKAALDLSPVWTIASILENSLRMGTQTLYFVTSDGSASGSPRSLYQAPLDGSQKATVVTLPQIGGAAATTVDALPTLSADRKTFVFLVGSSSTAEDVVTLTEGSSTLVKVSNLADNLYSSGTDLMDGSSPRLALSTTGKHVVFGTTTTATNKSRAWVAKADGTGTKVELSAATNFDATVTYYGSYHWASDDDLLLWAGTSTTTQNLFHYKVSTGALTNITGTGSATAAPWGAGTLECDGAWISPNGSQLYVVAGQDTAMNIMAINLTTWAKTDITTGLHINSESYIDDDLESVPGSSLVWFVARPANSGSTYVEDLYVFDQNTGSASSLKKLTQNTGTTTINVDNITPSPNGSAVAYTIGSGANGVLYVIPSSGTGTKVALNGSGSYLADRFLWTPDGKSLVHGGGSTSSSKLDLLITPASGSGTPKTLHAAQAYVFVANVGP